MFLAGSIASTFRGAPTSKLGIRYGALSDAIRTAAGVNLTVVGTVPRAVSSIAALPSALRDSDRPLPRET